MKATKIITYVLIALFAGTVIYLAIEKFKEKRAAAEIAEGKAAVLETSK